MKYIIIAFLFISCNQFPFTNNTPEVSTEPLDTIQSSSVKFGAAPVLFETAFIKGTTKNFNGSAINLYGVTIGKLKVVSGRIIACDPMHIEEYGKPFTQVFPTGEFAVQLSIAKTDEAETIAFARINFSNEPVVRWEVALQGEQAPLPVGSEQMRGYSVDAGVGVFIDAEANRALDLKTVDNMNGAVYQEIDKHYRNDWRYAVYNFGNHNLAAFSSGEGDGYYGSYIGFDASGKPCRLVTDFNIVTWKQSKK